MPSRMYSAASTTITMMMTPASGRNFRADGTRVGWVGTCTDLTDRRQREAALRMTEKLALTGRMTSVVAHEINNPLESIVNLLYLLNDRVKSDEIDGPDALVDALKQSLDADMKATSSSVKAVTDLVAALAEGVRGARRVAAE